VGRHVEVNDPPPLVAEDHKAVEQPERHRGHDEAIDRCQAIDRVGEEGALGLRRRPCASNHVPGHGGLGKVMAQ
jgi:hypothetical protein